MARKSVPFSLILLGLGCSTPAVEPVAQDPAPSTLAANDTIDSLQRDAHIWSTLAKDPSTLVFDNGDTLRTGLPGLQRLAQMSDPLGREWFVLSGLKNPSAKPETSLFVLSPSDSSTAHAFQQPWHMPGKLIDAQHKECYYEAQVFAGEVLRDTVGIIWYERSLMPDGTWRLNTTLLDLSGARPDTLVLFGHGRKSSTIDLAFRGKCRVLDSLDQHIDP